MLRNVGSNWALTLVSIAATYVLTPFVIGALGRDGYGTWTVITAMTGYMSLMALGVPMASVRYLAQHVAEGDDRRINSTISSCTGLYLLFGLITVVAGMALMLFFTAAYRIPTEWELESKIAFAIMIVQVSAGFLGLLPEGIMFAHHDFVPRNVIRVAGVVLRFSLTLGLLALRASLVALALVQLVCLAFDFGVSLLVIHRRYPNIRIGLSGFTWADVRRIFSFSVYVLLLSAGARLSFETDALVIGAMLGVAEIPYYAVANSLVVYLMEFIIAIAAVVSPMATRLHTQSKPDELADLFLKWSKVAMSLSIVSGVYLIVLGPRFIGWWIEPSYEGPSGQVLAILMISCLAFLPVRGVALPVLMGLGKPKAPTIAFIAAGVLNLVLSVALARPFGLAGVALGTAIPNVMFAGVVLGIACRELGVSVSRYASYVIPRAALGALPLILLLVWFRVGVGVEGLAGFAIAGSAMLLLFIPTWVFFVYRNDPFVTLPPRFARLRVWSRA